MSAPPRRQPPPEAQGPGQERPDGSVAYGVPGNPTVVITPARPAWERDADRAAYAEGCPRCAEVPADLMAQLVTALRAAKAGGGRP